MANFCLPKELTAPFLQALKSGKLDPAELSGVDSATRRARFAKIVGEDNAKEVNALFESKLLLKNQQAGIIRWARSVGGLSKEAGRDLFAKLERLDNVLSPEDEASFLNDLANKKLGTEASFEEVQTISELSKQVQEAQRAFDEEGKSGVGAAKVALEKYVHNLTRNGEKAQFSNPLKEGTVGGKAAAVKEDVMAATRFVADNSRAIKASVDNSLWFRQGYRMAADPRFTHIWAKNFAKSWGDIAKTMGGKLSGSDYTRVNKLFGKDAIDVGESIIDGLKADSYESPNYLNGRYDGKVGPGPKGTKLDIGTGEESYPTAFPAKIPLLGRFFKGSEVAYEGGALRLRRDGADQVYAWAERTGFDMNDNRIVGDLNEFINGLTGRGSFGKKVGSFEKGINSAFFSIKFFKSNLDYLTLHQGRLSTPATKLAATNLLYTIAVTGVMLSLVKAMWPDDNKDIYNPTSTNFGRAKFGPMTFDFTHGAGGIVVTAARILTQKTTSGSSGKTTKLGDKYGSATGDSVLWDFLGNKLSPIGQVIRETLINHKTFEGKKPTVAREVDNLTVPITIDNIDAFKHESLVMQILGLIADGSGISTNTYTKP